MYVSGIIGGSGYLSTWGKFRIAYGRNEQTVEVGGLVLTEFNREWAHGLKLAGGYPGWVVKPPSGHFDPILPDWYDNLFNWQPAFRCTPGFMPEDNGDIYLIGPVGINPSYIHWIVSEKLEAHLLGKNINSNDGSAPMTSSFWDGYYELQVIGNGSTTVTSVEGFENF
jgi:hypothetical protein